MAIAIGRAMTGRAIRYNLFEAEKASKRIFASIPNADQNCANETYEKLLLTINERKIVKLSFQLFLFGCWKQNII
jgi:hypothetical protein